jgi:hypothetical protein
MIENKTTTQANLVFVQSKVLVAKWMLHKVTFLFEFVDYIEIVLRAFVADNMV